MFGTMRARKEQAVKMDRNKNPNGKGKYALLNLRKNTIEWGCVGDEDEFFVVKLKDKHAKAALEAYAKSIVDEDQEFAGEVMELAMRAGADSPYCKAPD